MLWRAACVIVSSRSSISSRLETLKTPPRIAVRRRWCSCSARVHSSGASGLRAGSAMSAAGGAAETAVAVTGSRAAARRFSWSSARIGDEPVQDDVHAAGLVELAASRDLVQRRQHRQPALERLGLAARTADDGPQLRGEVVGARAHRACRRNVGFTSVQRREPSVAVRIGPVRRRSEAGSDA
jgi:hypothetical protein